jgi:hypothetical protein
VDEATQAIAEEEKDDDDIKDEKSDLINGVVSDASSSKLFIELDLTFCSCAGQ